MNETHGLLESSLFWFSSLPALMGVALFFVGLVLVFRRQKKSNLTIKLPGGGEVSAGALSTALLCLALLFLGVAHQFFLKQRELENAERQAAGFRVFIDLAKSMPEKQRDALFVAVANDLRNELRKVGPPLDAAVSVEALDRIDKLARFLLEIDPNNGHGLYFEGEVLRIRGPAYRDKFREHFNQFVSVAERFSPDSFHDHSTAEQGYATGAGFSAERIAWVLHLLANDFLNDALAEPERGSRAAKLRTARDKAERALQIRPSFDQTSAANRATTVVRDEARAELQKLGL
ncbi:MAG TPA: hypothetical protein VHD62_11110 [Opitutaceae bacterium]|nr:hypothetical protein [Opitutaceae bacterium]